MEQVAAQKLNELGLDVQNFEQFAANLVWRVGRLSEESPLTVRVGLATSVPMFNDLPKLRNATEAEIEAAMKDDDIKVEWVGRLPV